jgi:hypothetical protein
MAETSSVPSTSEAGRIGEAQNEQQEVYTSSYTVMSKEL